MEYKKKSPEEGRRERTDTPRKPFAGKEPLDGKVSERMARKTETSLVSAKQKEEKKEEHTESNEADRSSPLALRIMGAVIAAGGISLIADALINVSMSTGVEGLGGVMALLVGGTMIINARAITEHVNQPENKNKKTENQTTE